MINMNAYYMIASFPIRLLHVIFLVFMLFLCSLSLFYHVVKYPTLGTPRYASTILRISLGACQNCILEIHISLIPRQPIDPRGPSFASQVGLTISRHFNHAIKIIHLTHTEHNPMMMTSPVHPNAIYNFIWSLSLDTVQVFLLEK